MSGLTHEGTSDGRPDGPRRDDLARTLRRIAGVYQQKGSPVRLAPGSLRLNADKCRRTSVAFATAAAAARTTAAAAAAVTTTTAAAAAAAAVSAAAAASSTAASLAGFSSAHGEGATALL